MGWCHEFGVAVEAGCGHPMVAGSTACSCAECGTVCPGRFEGGCQAVWRRGPRPNAPSRPAGYLPRTLFETPPAVAPPGVVGGGTNGSGPVPPAPAESTAPVEVVLGADAVAPLVQRLGQVEAVLGRLAEQLARQSERQNRLERHLADLAKVVAQHGTEVDDRLVLFEMVLDDLTAKAAHSEATAGPAAEPMPEPQAEPEAEPEAEPAPDVARPLPFPLLSAVPVVEPPAADHERSTAAPHDGTRVHRLP